MVMKSDLQLEMEGDVQDAIEALNLLHQDLLSGRIDVDVLEDMGGHIWARRIIASCKEIMLDVYGARIIFLVPEERE